jgi:endonuclease YncB( thermonuclease family)
MRHLFLILLAITLPAWADTITGKVVGVGDGDTITVLDAEHQQHKIRLQGTDAPEKAQAFGQKSKASLSSMVFGKPVTVEWSKRDRYQRIIGVVLVDGVDSNLEQIKAGMAWWYKQYKREQTAQQRADYEAAENLARERRVGLWSDVEPVPPWEFRRAK